MKRVGFAVVGVRNFANEYIENIRSLGDEGIELTGVVVEDQVKNEARCRELRQDGVAVFDSYDQLLKRGHKYVDVIGLPVSIPTHAEMSIKGMEHGYDVLLEKPPAPTISELDAIQRTVERTNNFCSIGFQFMHSRSIRRLNELIQDGRLGEIEEIATKGYWPRTDAYYGRNPWAGKLVHDGELVLDGPVHNAFAHFLQNMLFLAGDGTDDAASLSEITAERYQANPAIEAADIATLQATTTEGIDISFYVTHVAAERQDPYMEVIGSEGRAEWHFDEETSVETDDGEQLSFGNDDVDPWLEVIRTAADRARGEIDELLCTPENTRSFVTAIDGSFESTERIKSVPETAVDTEALDNGETRRVVADLNDYLDAAFDRRVLLSDTDAPWAASTDSIDLTDYDQFTPIPIE